MDEPEHAVEDDAVDPEHAVEDAVEPEDAVEEDAIEPEDAVDTTLTHDELVILAALLRELIRTDGQISEEEIQGLDVVANRLGLPAARWKRVWAQASRELPNQESTKAAAAMLERTAAREFVYELLHNVASADDIVDPEWDLLEWIDEEWQARYASNED